MAGREGTLVLEIISGSKSAAQVCREYNLKPDLVSRGKNHFMPMLRKSSNGKRS